MEIRKPYGHISAIFGSIGQVPTTSSPRLGWIILPRCILDLVLSQRRWDGIDHLEIPSRPAPRKSHQKPQERLTTPTTILWQEHDPIFPTAWSDRIGEFFTDYELKFLPEVGHYTPLEAT